MRSQFMQIVVTGLIALATQNTFAAENKSILDPSNIDRLSTIKCITSSNTDLDLPEDLKGEGSLVIYNIRYSSPLVSVYGRANFTIGARNVIDNKVVEIGIGKRLKCDNSPCGAYWTQYGSEQTLELKYYLTFEPSTFHDRYPYLLENDFVGRVNIEIGSGSNTQDYTFKGTCSFELEN